MHTNIRIFENYLSPPGHFEELVEKEQTRLAIQNDAEVHLTIKEAESNEKLAALQASI